MRTEEDERESGRESSQRGRRERKWGREEKRREEERKRDKGYVTNRQRCLSIVAIEREEKREK